MVDYVVERVTLDVSVLCVGCGRVLKETQSLDGDAVRTGTQPRPPGTGWTPCAPDA